MTWQNEVVYLKCREAALARLERRRIETFIAAVSGDIAVLDALVREFQKDHDEYAEETWRGRKEWA